MIKQWIIIRKDLKMRRGKEIAQGAHASLSFLTQNINSKSVPYFSNEVWEWMRGSFTKVTLQVESEEELLSIYQLCQHNDILSYIITDSGKTEFNGVPTKTCMAIGPCDEKDVKDIIGHLKLY